MMRLLAYGAKEDDIVLILHMDRKDHSVMNYAQQFDRLPLKEMENLALLVIPPFEISKCTIIALFGIQMINEIDKNDVCSRCVSAISSH